MMRIIKNILSAVMVCAIVAFAAETTVDSTKQTTQPAPGINNIPKQVNIPVNTTPKAPTSWTKVKDLFL